MSLPTPSAYWPFDEASGATAADASGNGHTFTLAAAGSWVATGKFGAAAVRCSGSGKAATTP